MEPNKYEKEYIWGYLVTDHAKKRMFQRNISKAQVENALKTGELRFGRIDTWQKVKDGIGVRFDDKRKLILTVFHFTEKKRGVITPKTTFDKINKRTKFYKKKKIKNIKDNPYVTASA